MTKPQSWKSLRHKEATKPIFDESNVREAIARIGRTDDGLLLTEYLMNSRLMRPISTGLSDGALRDYAAETRLTLKLLSLLNGEIDDRRNDNRDHRDWRKRCFGFFNGRSDTDDA